MVLVMELSLAYVALCGAYVLQLNAANPLALRASDGKREPSHQGLHSHRYGLAAQRTTHLYFLRLVFHILVFTY